MHISIANHTFKVTTPSLRESLTTLNVSRPCFFSTINDYTIAEEGFIFHIRQPGHDRCWIFYYDVLLPGCAFH